jgi:outer membrane receptor protein involved in Fe transport
MRYVLLFAFWLALASLSFAQTPAAPATALSGRTTIKGMVVDTSGKPLAGATVMLLVPKDSSLTNFGRTADAAANAGAFELKGVRRGAYLLKITYIGYLPYQQTVQSADGPVTDLGSVRLKPIARELFEVVIRTAKAPLSIRGDTIEYNASSFKVPPGSTVEDLLRKLPGIQVDQDGNIRAQGKEVKRVTVDGKAFFGGDTKMATKNLAAESLAKVQVFDGQSEQAKLTGVDDGKKEKTLNLELKEEFKKGGFGKGTVAGGTQDRYELKGNYNKFNKKEQLSIIGNLNNVNRSGLSWNDYQDFRGSQSWSNDDGDFGFSGGNRYFYFGGGQSDDGDEVSLTIPVGGEQNTGFTESASGGANYNYDTKKLKVSSNYYFNQNRLLTDAEGTNRTFIPEGEYLTKNSSNRNTFTRNHRLSFRAEREFDSLNTLVLIGNGVVNSGNNRFGSLQDLFRVQAGTVSRNSSTSLVNGTNSQTNAFAGTAIFRHKFRKKGRNLALSGAFEQNQRDGDGDQRSRTDFFRATTVNDQLRAINQTNTTDSRRSTLKASVSYVEPLTKKIFWESFYNFSIRRDEADRDVLNLGDTGPVRNDTLSQYYVNNYTFNRFGSSLRYSFKGLNITGGLATQQFRLDGEFARDQTTPTRTPVQRTFSAILPNLGVNYDLKNNRYLSARYSVNVQLPTSRDLTPIIDNSVPLFIREGNPDLLPSLSRQIEADYNMFNPASFINLFAGINYNYTVNQIVYGQTIDPASLLTRTRPANVTGGQNLSTYVYFGFPLKKTKANLNLNGSLNVGNSFTPINDVLNETRTTSYNLGARLELTPSDKFTFYANANLNQSFTRYSISSGQNQTIQNMDYSAEMNVALPKSFYVNTNFNLNTYENDRFGFSQQVPILNVSVYKQFTKDKKAEIRLSVYDVFNRNLGVSQFASVNFVSEERTRTLARYAMLSFTYNMRGIKAKMRQDGWGG